MASSVPLVKATLLTLLDARPGLSGVQTEWSDPGDDLKQESMFFGTTELSEVSGQLGNGTRHESYTLTLWIFVLKDGNNPQATEERSWALAAEVEALLKSNASLGLTQPNVKSLTAEFAGAEQDNVIVEEGRMANLKVSVGVEARI